MPISPLLSNVSGRINCIGPVRIAEAVAMFIAGSSRDRRVSGLQGKRAAARDDDAPVTVRNSV
jgi:hypothetical protein